ncbi:bacteriocin [Acuticoccus sediminis]|uniref:Bacteriocin n=1 Tax=Acuticoccus sediminis TaxID=2184697 RepID=A0A8B2NP41_9HYPH|nr:bacteriocin [Acuticoccus sediminis]RAI00452.1 bacteriocin [Acuticoccus sediminis]
MKKILIAVALAAGLAGCNANNTGDRALVGGALGAATGAGVAALTGASAGGVVAGSVIGGAGGAVLGAATTPRCVNQYNQPVQCP